MANQNGIFITLKAWLPVTGSISEQIAKLQMVEKAHVSGDYAELLGAAKVEEIKTEQKTRRIDDEPAQTEPATIADEILGTNITGANDASDEAEPVEADPVDPAKVPKFLKNKQPAATDEAA